MNILITGGTGTLGKALVKSLGTTMFAGKIAIFSRDELKQSEMKQDYPEGGETGLRYFIGDVRDKTRLIQATKDMDIVIHAAAMKQVDTCEYNPTEAVRTNVLGAMNITEACVKNNVKKALLISTDKAPNATTNYGASKFIAERLFINSNNFQSTKFSCVRYGNIINSRGSIIPKWEKKVRKLEPLPVTDINMTRFFWKIEEAAGFVLETILNMDGGEIFVPKMNAYRVHDIAKKMSSNIKIVGIRGNEKINETLITKEETLHTFENGNCYVIYPYQHDWCTELECKGKKVDNNFKYNSDERISEWSF